MEKTLIPENQLYLAMVDIMSGKKRSQLMSKIKGKDTKIELTMRAELRKRKEKKFKVNATVNGKPDIVFLKEKIAVFCDGDFWHGRQFYKWKQKLAPFWFKKISGNMERDRRVTRELKKEHWKVIRFWERDIEKNVGMCVETILEEVAKRRKELC